MIQNKKFKKLWLIINYWTSRTFCCL